MLKVLVFWNLFITISQIEGRIHQNCLIPDQNGVHRLHYFCQSFETNLVENNPNFEIDINIRKKRNSQGLDLVAFLQDFTELITSHFMVILIPKLQHQKSR